MIAAVIYSESNLTKVNTYNSLTHSEQISYWDKTHDDELSDLKESIKDHYIKAQDYTCPYCKQRMEVEHKATWDAEHIIPKATRPEFMFTERNLCVSCKDCNRVKGNKNVLKNPRRATFPDKSEDYLFCHPHFDEYDLHIKIIAEACFYLPKTDKGRETVETCGLLRFLYKFADYAPVSDEIARKLGVLHAELMLSSDPIVQTFLLNAISTIAKEGIQLQRERGMEKLFQPAAPTPV